MPTLDRPDPGAATATATDARARIRQAIATIGEEPLRDYAIAPQEHAALYAAAAPELADRLRDSDLQATARLWDDRDRKAVEAQKLFLAKSAQARNAVFLAGAAAALLVATGSISALLDPRVSRAALLILSVAAAIAGALAAGWIQQIKAGRLLETWMTRRAEAETQRLRYFDLVVRARALAEPLLQLEYFRRYQLDVQTLYYGSRGEDHERAAQRALSLTTTGIIAATVLSGLAGALSASLGAAWTGLAGLGLVAQAASTRADNREATAQNRRNAERYDRTHTALLQLSERLGPVRQAVAAGELAVMNEFVAAVQEQISVEHRQWLEDSRNSSEAVARLEALLDEYAKRAERKG